MNKQTIARKITTIGNSRGVTLPPELVELGKYYKITIEPINSLDELEELQETEQFDIRSTRTDQRVNRTAGLGKAGQILANGNLKNDPVKPTSRMYLSPAIENPRPPALIRTLHGDLYAPIGAEW